MPPDNRTWGKIKPADVMAALSDGRWRGYAEIAKAIGTGKVSLVAYRCRVMRKEGLLEFEQIPYHGTGGTPKNMYRINLSAVQSAES